MADLHIADIEAAINHWRRLAPSVDGVTLAPPVQALAEVYARMSVRREEFVDEQALDAAARAAWLQWYATTPDTPCIAICSTSQGDAVCKRQVWRRITAEGEAWRFNRYAERAGQRAFADTPDDVDTS